MRRHELTLVKRAQRQIAPEVLRRQLDAIVLRGLGGNRRRQGWKLIGLPSWKKGKEGKGLAYSARLAFKRTARKVSAKVEEAQFAHLCAMAAGACPSRGWALAQPMAEKGKGSPSAAVKSGKDQFAELPPILPGSFGHIFDRDAQINIVSSALEAARSSRLQNRFHCVLHGPPGCGKTSILDAFAMALGPDAVLKFDATSTSKAGAEKTLLESAEIPPVLIVEEIEKTDEDSLRWLLGLLDHRAEIRKTNFNVGNVRREVKLLCLATANDIAKFNGAMSGALASRFAHKIYCPRPDRGLLERILGREIDSIGGDRNWIAPALDYCIGREKTDDPRRIAAVCLSGRDQLLTGEFQRFLEATRDPLDGKGS